MKHIFDVEIAKEYGVNAAIILENINFWIQKNEANEVNFFDGNYWTYNSVRAMEMLFPYMTTKQIRNAIDVLVDAGLVVIGNYNENPMNRTKWYALTEKGKSICQKGQVLELPKTELRSAQKGKCSYYTDINRTDINTDIDVYNARSRKNGSKPESDKTPVFITFPLNTGEEYPITEGSISKWEQLYPAVDIRQELRKMRGWLDSNPTKRKTRGGVARFVTGWLSREQDRGGSAPQQPKPAYQPQKEDNPFTRLREKYEREERMAAGIEDYLEVEEND